MPERYGLSILHGYTSQAMPTSTAYIIGNLGMTLQYLMWQLRELAKLHRPKAT